MKKRVFSKKGDMAMTLIITTVILLMIFALYFGFIKDSANTYKKGTGCEALGGVLASSCPEQYAKVNHLFEKDKDGNVCCISKTGTQSDSFDEWAKTQQANSNSQEGGSGESGSSSTVDTNDYSDGNYYVAPDKIPEYGNGETILLSGPFVTGKVYFKINNVSIQSKKTARVYAGKVSLSAVNTNEGVASCELYVMKQENGKFVLPSEKSYLLKPCKKGSELQLTLKDLPAIDELYKVDFVAKKSDGSNLMSDTVYFKTTDLESESSSTDNLLTRKIVSLKKSISRNNRLLTFVSPEVIGPTQLQELRTSYSIESPLTDCSVANVEFHPYSPLRNILVPKDKKVCLVFDLLKSPLAIAANEILSIENTDELTIVDKKTYDLYFNSCSKTCSDFNSPKSACKNFNERGSDCMYSLDCYWSKKEGSRSCLDCSGVTSCSDFDLQAGCENNNCIPSKCVWNEKVIGHGNCVDAS